MGEPLSPEQVAEIRRELLDDPAEDPNGWVGTALALCDTVDALRAEAAQSLAGALCQIEDQQTELETLRGMARRVRDGWVPSWSDGDWIAEGWYWLHDRRLDSVRLTAAEVKAIYGGLDVRAR